MKIKKLKPIRQSPEDYEPLEKLIADVFKKYIFAPLVKEIPFTTQKEVFQNEKKTLVIDALERGQISFNEGVFSGKFNIGITKQLRELGATWDKSTKTYRILKSKLPNDIVQAVAVSNSKFERVVDNINAKLSSILPEQVAENFKGSSFLDSTLFRKQKSVNDTLDGITVSPKLSPEARKMVADEYNLNLKKYIKDWTEEEIITLRKKITEQVIKGVRYEEMIDLIKSRYGVSQSKAKFLARQETSLMTAKFTEARYKDVGVKKYIWKTVIGSPRHPVRAMHKKLDGKIFSFDDPPVTDENGNRNNPGEDYNCRCLAIPIVEF